jgi:hypothetical protein
LKYPLDHPPLSLVKKIKNKKRFVSVHRKTLSDIIPLERTFGFHRCGLNHLNSGTTQNMMMNENSNLAAANAA